MTVRSDLLARGTISSVAAPLRLSPGVDNTLLIKEISVVATGALSVASPLQVSWGTDDGTNPNFFFLFPTTSFTANGQGTVLRGEFIALDYPNRFVLSVVAPPAGTGIVYHVFGARLAGVAP